MRLTSRATLANLGEWCGAAMLFAVLTAVVTWPQVTVWDTHTLAHHDALFSMWRLSWIAEVVPGRLAQLFDAPIFHPAERTFAFSDAVLLQGLIATPALRAGVPVLPVYNVLLLAGPWLSALGTYLLVRSLLAQVRPGQRQVTFWPALVAGTIFGLLPYRIEHLKHLELQWAQWMPLACWALHRTVWHGRIRDGVLTAVFVLAQFLSCIYYGIFLVLTLAACGPLLLLLKERASLGRIVRALAVGGVLCILPLAAYRAPYRVNQEALGGGRAAWEIDTWSATPAGFVSAPPENRLYGATSALTGGEGRLMPGVVAAALALAGAWYARRRREAWMYVTMLALSGLLALGTHTVVYRIVLALVPPLRGLRAPARFGMVMALALAVLAAYGVAHLLARVPRRAWVHALGAVMVAALVVEYASAVGPLHAWVQRPPVYAMYLRSRPAGAVLDLPVPRTWALPNHDAEWSYLARFHGHPLVNGYSGYYPPAYLELLDTLIRFPNEASLDALRARGVRYIVVHEDRYAPADFAEFEARLRRTPGLRFAGRLPDPTYPVTLFTLE